MKLGSLYIEPKTYFFEEYSIRIVENCYDIVFPWVLHDYEQGTSNKLTIDYLDEDTARDLAKAVRRKRNLLKEDWWNYW